MLQRGRLPARLRKRAKMAKKQILFIILVAALALLLAPIIINGARSLFM